MIAPVSVPALRHVTFEEYLANEVAEATRHEFVGGVVYAMTGGTRRHNQIAGRIYRAVAPAAEAMGCRAYIADMKLRVSGAVYYPDVFVTCDPAVDDLYEVSACLVVEVLSPSTTSIDRREKLAAYTTSDSTLVYLLVHPDRPEIEVHERQDGCWTARLAGAGEQVVLICPGLALDVDSLYGGLPA